MRKPGSPHGEAYDRFKALKQEEMSRTIRESKMLGILMALRDRLAYEAKRFGLEGFDKEPESDDINEIKKESIENAMRFFSEIDEMNRKRKKDEQLSVDPLLLKSLQEAKNAVQKQVIPDE